MQVIMKSYVKLSDLIIAIKNTNFNQGSYFCLYSKDSMEPLASSSVCFVDEYPKERGGEDVFPEDVVNNDLELCYYGEQFVDVINNVVSQVNDPPISVFIDALNYYMDNDDFLDTK
ncbi:MULTISPECIES: DUF7716 domain-containing protein [Buttiauxella]|uniref:DUF7716 domain-containing protein n=1 Tax=Buttiauxella TaxID=82976 RepID=UPI0010618573|nr:MULTISPECIES: hypothetical protein [Buttiauxella]TDN51106.1 hypothetical protein EC843_104117 [Buttiauxella sp. JUb87]UNK59729.1 hypothetical protein MNO13_15165 [Buttiauxella ferragutiae]